MVVPGAISAPFHSIEASAGSGILKHVPVTPPARPLAPPHL